jgi:ABC-type polysaccharide/polyol phosphate export permease
MLQPLGMMVVMTIVFSQLFHRIEGYASYLLSGLISWTFFSQTTIASLKEVVSGGSLARRIYVPHTAFAISSLLTGMVNLSISIIPLVLITLLVGRPVTWAVLFTPVSILILSAFTLGVGLLLSTFAVHFPDIKEMYDITLRAWMYLTPIIYPETILPEPYRFWILHLNPMYYMVRLFRDPVYSGILPSANILITSTIIGVITLTAGWIYFSKQADSFAYKA